MGTEIVLVENPKESSVLLSMSRLGSRKGKKHHGGTRASGEVERTYSIWKSMRQRCYNAKHHSYARYGGRGIRVCSEWALNYVKFRTWALSSGYSDALQIDRIDVNGNYTPENCRWVTPKQQGRNRRNTRYVTYRGETRPLREWTELLGLHYEKVMWRLDHDTSAEIAFQFGAKGADKLAYLKLREEAKCIS